MARPPQIPNWLLDHLPTIYFVTFCTQGRKPTLANLAVFDKVRVACEKVDGWWIASLLVMPDHIHCLMAPGERSASVKAAIAKLKRWIRQGDLNWQWQSGCFDRLLRTNESAQQKWEYIRANPVRAGLVKDWEQWPYRLDLPLNSQDKL